MSRLFVAINNRPIKAIPFDSSCNLFKLLGKQRSTSVRSACQGKGICGLCLVRIDRGSAGMLTQYEHKHLSERQIAAGVRLACQVTLFDDASVTLINPLMIEALDFLIIEQPLTTVNTRYTAAVDLGSTQLRMSLWDSLNRRRIAAYCGFNPQARYGTDILNRLTCAATDHTAAAAMSELILDAMEQVISDWIDRLHLTIEEILLVGNTAMLALLANKHAEQLLQPAYWTEAIDCSLDFATLRQTHIPIAALGPMAGFIGSDILAGLLAVRLTERSGSALFIDFGTNTEIVLWHKNRLWITSVPGGPAYEGCGINYGVAAEHGAIGHVSYDAETGAFHGALIGSGEVKGLCGSGLVDMVACLLQAGQLKKNGCFADAVSELEIEFTELSFRMTIKKQDIDIFQRAKAATGAGIAGLLSQAGVSSAELTRVCIAGSFGQYLSIRNAQAIGLLPDCTPAIVELCGNSALIGCEQLLSSPNRDEQVSELMHSVKVINLSLAGAYEEIFVDHLYLRRWSYN